MRKFNDVSFLVGNTPLVRMNKITKGLNAEIFAKLELFNPGGSIKDRIALSMIEAAEKNNLIVPGKTTIVEPTSGNTGIGLAWVCVQKGYKLVIVMPENMSDERKKTLSFLGAEIVLTDPARGMTGSVLKAEEILENNPSYFMPDQFNNQANPKIHELTTAREIWRDTDGRVDIVIAGIGTGGTITGVAQYLKSMKKSFKAVGVEPESSAVLSGESSGSHNIPGIGAGFVPKVLQIGLLDEIVKVSDKDAAVYTKRIAQEEGVLAGISSGAALSAAVRVAQRKENKEKLIVVIFPDGSQRYISTDLLKP